MEASHEVQKVKLLWAAWDIRVFMLTSLLIQTLLTFLAPLRKRCSSSIFNFLMWLLYLSADAVALFTIGLISSGQGDSPEKTELLAFWAPFLLLHLGGPDTITALALEDNELWHRHTLQLVTQVGVTVYVFIQSFQHSRHLLLPTIFMFANGCIKYAERICALYLASADAFRESVLTETESGPSYDWLMEEYYAASDAHIHVTLQRKINPAENTITLQGGDDPLDLDQSSSDEDFSGQEAANNDNTITDDVAATPEIESGVVNEEEDCTESSTNINVVAPSGKEQYYSKMVNEAYYFYVKFRGLLADGFISFEDRKESRDFFLSKPDLEPFRIVEMELNIIYDVFYTKVFLLQRKQAYLRVVALLSIVTSLLLFTLKHKRKYAGIDLVVTFALLTGGLVLDVCAVVVFILSDWWIIIISRDGKSEFLQSLFPRLLKWSKRLMRRPRHSRWSQSISQHNLLNRCLKDPPSILKFIFVKNIRDGIIGWLYGDNQVIDERLVQFIVDELRLKAKLVSEDVNAIKEVCSARGNLVLQSDYSLISEFLYPWTMGIDYDESLLTWHFATEICYWSSPQNGDQTDFRKLSKTLSDYMSYLLLTKQAMVSSVVGKSEMLFEDTRAEVKKLMKTKMVDFMSAGISEKAISFVYNKLCRSKNDQEFSEQFSKRVLESYVRPMMDKGDKSKYLLFNARHLAEQLNMIGDVMQWEITSKVWLELLCYAAIRSSPRSHVAELSKGGELITLVWLLMTHFGLGDRFLQNQGLRWTKLIIAK